MPGERRVSVIMATFNRAESTIRSIRSLNNEKPLNWKLNIYVTDSDSSDDTSGRVAKLPNVKKVVQGKSNWYWAKAMSEAHCAIEEDFDFQLWLNDDVQVSAGGLEILEKTSKRYPASIIVGSTRGFDSDQITYGGYRKVGRHPFKYVLVQPGEEAKEVDTFNGNIVLIPKELLFKVGPIDGRFGHAYADIDYGLRAKKYGAKSILSPGFVGYCEANNAVKTSSSLLDRWKALNDPKGLPIKSQVRFLIRHGGNLWPIYILPPIIRTLFLPNYRNELQR